MRRLYCLGMLGVLGLILSAPARADVKGFPKEESCGEYGTSVKFEESPSHAARKAVKEQKLVFVLHVSGNFEDPTFT